MRRTHMAFVLTAALGLLPLLALPAMAQPGNDSIESATEVVEPLPFQDGPLDTSEATGDPSDPGCISEPGDPGNPTVWYVYTPSETFAGSIRVDTFGSNYDTTLSAYVAEGEDLIQIACNDDAASLQSLIVVDVAAGETVFLMVGAFGGEPGGGTLFLNVDISDIEPPQVELTIDPVGMFHKDGSATVSGTFTCTGDADFAEVFGDLRQSVGRFTITGFFGVFGGGEPENGDGNGEPELTCDGTTQSWSAQVHADNGLFRGGRATVEATVFACGFFECAEDSVAEMIRLRRG